jgi:hypothetical protein
MLKKFILGLCTLMTIGTQAIQAEVKGKLDVGPAFIHLDILESGRTVKRMDMMGVRGDFSYYLYQGLYIKPTVLYGNGGSAKGGVFTGSLAVGYCFPICEHLLISPAVGGNYNHIWTKIDVPHFQLKNLRENFKSWAPFLSCDFHYTFIPSWRICIGVQYAWSHTKTSIQHLVKNDKSKSEGFTYSALLEHDMNDQWSWNVAAAYNLSLTKEKHGIRGTGVKVGVVRWF